MTIYCVICQKKVESHASKYRKWGRFGEGWGCEAHWNGMGQIIELVPDHIASERVQFAGDQIQSHRQGELSKEWVDRYPHRVKGMVKEGVITEKQVEKAKKVWTKDMRGLE